MKEEGRGVARAEMYWGAKRGMDRMPQEEGGLSAVIIVENIVVKFSIRTAVQFPLTLW
jgi:hypothetical protein